MKTFNKLLTITVLSIFLIFAGINLFLYHFDTGESGRQYRVEIERLALEIEEKGLENIDLSGCEYVMHVSRRESEPPLYDGTHNLYGMDSSIQNTGGDFYDTDSDYIIREINGILYRFDYVSQMYGSKKELFLAINIMLGTLSALILCTLFFIRNKILSPFERLKNVPYELSKGNLTVPIKENKSRFFGKFVWGINLLRENIEEQKERELALQKEKKTLLLSLSHDIKTPLSAIKLYAKALTKNLYQDKEKQREIAENIHLKADEIESYVSQIITASKEDFLSFEVDVSEFYLSDLMQNITGYYREKLAVIKTDFTIAAYENCLLTGDLDRAAEVMQNIMENAIKYGDGRTITITFAEEEDCQLITIESSGCTLSDAELPHIFESFWRGANAANTQGSGLGLYICRQLMHTMKGDIYAKITGGRMFVTLVFGMAG